MSTPAGWYDDGQGQQRYWDGNAWTDHVSSAVGQAPPQAAAPQAPVAPQPTVAQEPPVAPQPQVYPASEPTYAPPAAHYAPPAPQYAPGGAPSPQPGYGAPGQPGYGVGAPSGYAPGYPPAPKSRKGLWIGLIIGGAVVLLAVIVIVVLVIVNVVRGATDGPQKALTVYNTAWMDGDCAAIESVTTDNWKDEWGYDCSEFQDSATYPQSWQMDVTSTSVSGGEADVDYTLSGVYSDGESFDAHYTAVLIQQNGAWLVDDDEYLD